MLPLEGIKVITRDGADARMGAVPALGQHSRAILAELGFEAGQIAQLERDGAV